MSANPHQPHPIPAAAGPLEFDTCLRISKVQLLYRQAIPAMALSVVAAAIVCMMLWPAADRGLLIGWFAATVVVALGRSAIVFRYHVRRPSELDCLRWERPFLASLLVSAAVWGIGGLMIMPVDSLPHQTALYFILLGMAGGASASYSASGRGVIIVVLLILMPITLWMFAQARLLPVGMALGACLYMVGTMRAVRVFNANLQRSILLSLELERAHASAARLARTDELSKLPNRRAFLETGHRMCASASRLGHELSLIMLDIDHFKKVNDSRGHAAGDTAIRHVADILMRTSRQADFCGRLGGEEFALLLPGTSREHAIGVAEKLRAQIAEQCVACDDHPFRISASFGVASDCEDLDRLLHAADSAMYEAKRSGRNRVAASKPAD